MQEGGLGTGKKNTYTYDQGVELLHLYGSFGWCCCAFSPKRTKVKDTTIIE